MSNRETKRYFETAVNYFKENYGTENIRYADVHMDETTPHMHMGIVPFTKDYRLSSKEVFNRTALRKVQDDFPKYMQEHGFAVERGHEDSERKKLTVKEYKQVQAEIHKQNEGRSKARQKISENIKSIAPNLQINYKDGTKSDPISIDTGFKSFLKQSVNWLTHVLLHQLQLLTDRLRKQAVSLNKREQNIKKREVDLDTREQQLASQADLAEYLDRLPRTVSNQLTLNDMAGRLRSMSDADLVKMNQLAVGYSKITSSKHENELLKKAAKQIGVDQQLATKTDQLRKDEQEGLANLRRLNGFNRGLHL